MHEEDLSSENLSHSSQPSTHKQEQHGSAKVPPISKQRAQRDSTKQRRDEEREQMEQERRRLENERRLDAQRLEYERKLEARRKAEEAAAATPAQNEIEERSTNEGEVPQRHSGNKKTPRVRRRKQQKAECRGDIEGGSPTVAIKMDGDQKVHIDDNAETVGAPGPRILVHDTGAACLAITDEEPSKSHLIMMAHVSHAFPSIVPLGYDGNEKLINNRISRPSECWMFSRLQRCH